MHVFATPLWKKNFNFTTVRQKTYVVITNDLHFSVSMLCSGSISSEEKKRTWFSVKIISLVPRWCRAITSCDSERPLEAESCHGAAHVVSKERERITNPIQRTWRPEESSATDSPSDSTRLDLTRLRSTGLASFRLVPSRLVSSRLVSLASRRPAPSRVVSYRIVSRRVASLVPYDPLRHVASRTQARVRLRSPWTRVDPRWLVTIPTSTSTPIRARYDHDRGSPLCLRLLRRPVWNPVCNTPCVCVCRCVCVCYRERFSQLRNCFDRSNGR